MTDHHDESYTGPERREYIRREEDLEKRYGPFTTWQWAVMAVMLICLVQQVRLEIANNTIDKNSTRSVTAICSLVGFTESSITVTEEALKREPTGPLAEPRRESLERLRVLVKEQRKIVPDCPEKFRPPVPG